MQSTKQHEEQKSHIYEEWRKTNEPLPEYPDEALWDHALYLAKDTAMKLSFKVRRLKRDVNFALLTDEESQQLIHEAHELRLEVFIAVKDLMEQIQKLV